MSHQPSAHLVLPLESCSDPALVGGKAAGLGLLLRNGFRVPPGVCVTTLTYRETMQAAGLDLSTQENHIRRASDTARGPMLEQCRRLIASFTLPQPLLGLLNQELDRLGVSPDTLLAVRSSAADEDMAKTTCAGQYRTLLGIRRDSVPSAILDCWASLWTSTSFAYRSHVTKSASVPAMAGTEALFVTWLR